jgi:alpha-glucosidase
VATAEDNDEARLFGQRWVYNANRPEVHDVIRHWRGLADSYESRRILVGETPVDQLDTLAAFYGTDDDELHLAFNFEFINAPLEAAAMRTIVEGTEAALPPGAWPAWTGSNHDMSRLATRWANGIPLRARTALVMLLGLRGTPVLYQGDEIGLVDTAVAREDLRDPLGVRYWPAYQGRDAMRTPMHWRNVPGGGFTTATTKPWLPLGDLAAYNVEDQRADPASILTLTRDLIALRKRSPDLQTGAYTSLPSPSGVWAWRRGDGTAVVANLSDNDETLEGVGGRVLIGTDRGRDGDSLHRSITLRGWEALVVQLG